MTGSIRRFGLIVALVSLLGLTATSTATGHGEEHAGPSFEVQVLKDPVQGWNILIVTDLIWAPENVSSEHVEGEGHAHVYVDGVKVSRIYGMWHHIGDLAPGTHEVRIELSQNDHAPLVVGDHVLDETVTIQQPEPAGHTDDVESREVPADQPIPAISAEAIHDPAGGFNLQISVENFTIDGAKASRDPADGEGHARLYINGEQTNRIYEQWTQIAGLEAGQHEITVALVANDHAPLTHDGAPIQTSFTLDATAELLTDSGEHHHHEDDGEHDHADDTDMGQMGDEEPTHDMATG